MLEGIHDGLASDLSKVVRYQRIHRARRSFHQQDGRRSSLVPCVLNGGRQDFTRSLASRVVSRKIAQHGPPFLHESARQRKRFLQVRFCFGGLVHKVVHQLDLKADAHGALQ